MTSTQPIGPILAGFLSQTREYALIVLDARGVITQWLGAAADVLGFTAEEVLGLPIGVLFTDADRAKGLDTVELELARTTGRSEDDRWHVRKDGLAVWVTG